ncbi:MAG: ribonuclease P protein component [Planctomycetota bacterium]|jgi:ribonuclease P protein component
MARFSFPKQARLLHERDFRRVYRTGRRLQVFPLRFCAARLPEGKSRLGLAVSRKVGNAVVRNRWKRAVREAFRLNRHRLHAAYDLVVSVSWETSPQDVRLVPTSFDRVIEALNASGAEDNQ